MKITILGSSGQIGSYLTDYLRKKDYEVLEFDITNGDHQDMTHIPNTYLRNAIMNSDFVFFLAFDVGGSRYLKKYQHTFNFIKHNVSSLFLIRTLFLDHSFILHDILNYVNKRINLMEYEIYSNLVLYLSISRK